MEQLLYIFLMCFGMHELTFVLFPCIKVSVFVGPDGLAETRGEARAKACFGTTSSTCDCASRIKTAQMGAPAPQGSSQGDSRSQPSDQVAKNTATTQHCSRGVEDGENKIRRGDGACATDAGPCRTPIASDLNMCPLESQESP